MTDEHDPSGPEDKPPSPPREGGAPAPVERVDSEAAPPETPRVAEEAPWIAEDAPGVAAEAPRVVEETPRVVEEAPRAAENSPRVVDEPPEDLFETLHREPPLRPTPPPTDHSRTPPERQAPTERVENKPPPEPPRATRAPPEGLFETLHREPPPRQPPPPPPGYFGAAGDPDDEPPPENDSSVFDRIGDAGRNLEDWAKPRLKSFWDDVGAVIVEFWRRMRGIRSPRSVREAAVWSGWAAAAGVAAVVGFFFFVTWGMPSTDDLWEARQGQSITFLDRNGHVILREGAQNAPPVDLASLPPYVAQAFIAIEDRRFYNHLGVDFGGMMRAGAENMRAGRVVQGGSTITQQLAKNLFLSNERSWRRKAQEIMLAFWLESRFTKDEILALYLSRVYFGAGAYGVEAAAERYFDRPARQLTLLQSAMLAGLVKAPSRLNPARQDIEAARERATVVLDEMVNMGFISAAERQAALQEELTISRRNPAGVLSYYRDWIDPLLNDVIGQQRDDFIIETTIDIAAQRAAAESVDMVLSEQGEARRASQAAALVMDDGGGIRAMVGGRDYDQSQFNRATQAHRQPGSSFKYFIYLAAMENGLTPWTIREDEPITIHINGQPDWSPGNYEDRYHGPVTLTGAFANSFNMVAIRVANEIGGDKVIAVAERLGVQSPLHNYHSLALGAQEVTLMELVSAYGAMASEGYRVNAHGITRIRRANGETMWSWRGEHTRVIEERPMRYMNLMMQRVVQAGTGTRARMSNFDIGGKTGTGNDYRDAWFIGFTPGMVGGVWVGNDNFTTTARVTGGSLPADIWARFMPVALRDTPSRPLQLPREEDYDIGLPEPEMPTLTAVGAPVGATIGAPAAPPPPDTQDRSLDFGPEG